MVNKALTLKSFTKSVKKNKSLKKSSEKKSKKEASDLKSNKSTRKRDSSPKDSKKSTRFACITGAYNLNISSQDSSLKSFTSLDLKPESHYKTTNKVAPKAAWKKLKGGFKPSKRPNKPPYLKDSLLYDTGFTDYIINNKKQFTSYTPFNRLLKPIYTGRGPCIPEGQGTVVFTIVCGYKLL